MNDLHSVVEVSLLFEDTQTRCFMLPAEITLGRLRLEIRSHIADASLEVLDLPTLPDSCSLSSISTKGAIQMKVTSTIGPRLGTLDRIIKAIRSSVRCDPPEVQEKHDIKENHRWTTSAVTGALARARVLPSSMPTNPMHFEPILENSEFLNEEGSTNDDLKRICCYIVDVLEKKIDLDEESALELARDLRSCLEAYLFQSLSQEMIIDSIRQYESLPLEPIDGTRLYDTIKSLATSLNASSVDDRPTESEVAEWFLYGENTVIPIDLLGRFVNSIKSKITTQTNSEALLPNPTSKARLSPDMMRWAEELRPKDKGKL